MTDLSSLRQFIDDSLDSFANDLLDELKRFEASIAEKDALLAVNDSTIQDLRNRVRSQEIEISGLNTHNAFLTKLTEMQAAEIERLKALVPSVPVVTPPNPPIVVNAPPSFSISVSPDSSSTPVTFKPSGPGIPNPYSPSERRWHWDLDSEVRIILDAREGNGTSDDQGQRRITFQRAWSDLPLTAPTRELQDIFIKDNDDSSEIEALRLHHHTRHTVTFNRQLPGVIFTKNLPNYDFDAGLSQSARDWRWNPSVAKDADLISENYYLAHQSWVGGVPLANEASILPPWDVEFLASGFSSSKQQEILGTWDSIGNYPIHFFDRETGKPCLPSSPSATSIPVLNLDNFPLPDAKTKLTTRSGAVLPVPDMAHNFGLPNLGALSTRDLFYIEASESFVLLGSLSRKTTDSFIPRSSGLYFSGQVRSTAWWMRDLYHLYLATNDVRFKHQMIRQLDLLERTFTIQGAADYRPTGLLSLAPRKTSPWNQFSAPTSYETPTGNHHFLAYVLGEISQHPEFASSVRPILLHVLKVAEGTWHHSPSKYFAPWLRHAVPSSSDSDVASPSWIQICLATFKNFYPVLGKLGAPTPGFAASPLTYDIACWYRAAVVTAVEAGLPWSSEALKWLDSQIPVSRRPVAWNIKPRTGAGK